MIQLKSQFRTLIGKSGGNVLIMLTYVAFINKGEFNFALKLLPQNFYRIDLQFNVLDDYWYLHANNKKISSFSGHFYEDTDNHPTHPNLHN